MNKKKRLEGTPVSTDPPVMLQPERTLRMLAAAAGHPNLASLARAVPCDRHTLVDGIRGTKKPIRAVVERVARVLGVDDKMLTRLFASARGYRPRTLDKLVMAVAAAIHEYDSGGDHARHAGGAADDCIRCKLVAAMPFWSQPVRQTVTPNAIEAKP